MKTTEQSMTAWMEKWKWKNDIKRADRVLDEILKNGVKRLQRLLDMLK